MSVVNIGLYLANSVHLQGGAIQTTGFVAAVGPQDITPTNTAQQTSISVPSGIPANVVQNYLWVVSVYGMPVRVRAGANPTATATGDLLLVETTTYWFGASAAGEKLSIILATT